MNIIIIGRMDNSDGTHEQLNRVYGADGLAPTLDVCSGGGRQPKIVEVTYEDKGKQCTRVL